MNTHGIEINDSQLLPLRKVLKSWIECIEEYIAVWEGDDLPYWYNERANISIFAGAAWRIGMTAIEEYQSEKIADSGEGSNGRNDLYLADNSMGVCIEAKVAFPKITSAQEVNSLISGRLIAAMSDVKRLQEEGQKVAVLFVAPYSESEKASEEEIRNFLSSLSSFSVGACAWCAVSAAQSKTSHDGKYYPVVAIMLRRA